MTIEKTTTGIAGLDQISHGGLPKGRTTMVSGSAGSGKTVMAGQFLVAAITDDEAAGVFVTFEEPPVDIARNLSSFGWDIDGWTEQGKWTFIDASMQTTVGTTIVGEYDFAALMARIEDAVRRTGATRIVMDSIGAVFAEFDDTSSVRRELHRLAKGLSRMGVTCMVTAERDDEYGAISRFGVEQFVADDVLVLRHVLRREEIRRTIQILKFRGTTHRKGEFPFTIDPEQGMVVIPVTGQTRQESSSTERVSSGDPVLDEMCGGGVLRDSVILVSGATGTGKTLTATTFLAGGVAQGERALLFGYEESREQLYRNAEGWGFDFLGAEKAGRLRVVCEYPEVRSLEDHLLIMRRQIDEFEPDRVALDSLSAMEHIASPRAFRQYMMGVTAILKERQITGIMTATTPTLLGGDSITVSHISTLTDSIILLRYVEVYGEIKRGITVLKMRGSAHDKEIREVVIDGKGMNIGMPFRFVEGILGGTPVRVGQDEDRLRGLFSE